MDSSRMLNYKVCSISSLLQMSVLFLQFITTLLISEAVTLLEGAFAAILLTYQHLVYISVGRRQSNILVV